MYEAELHGLAPVGSTWSAQSGRLLESLLTYGEYTTAKIRGSWGDKLQVIIMMMIIMMMKMGMVMLMVMIMIMIMIMMMMLMMVCCLRVCLFAV